ncbi:peptidase G1 domain-containing protein [Phanerochaete sordida]|uniref:Peptidase G1 domain-containing protein n=1 Tax=Phanerochaete sordida TaxID=48140 RepID=A0A9P3GJW9_9APHY|nr:peptidase G1 domain-containing protein [Phanerochaete sordida]
MRSSILLVGALLAATAFAFPSSKQRFASRMARRANSTSHLTPAKFDATTARRAMYSSHPKITNETHVQYSSNWAGAVINSYAGAWSSVQGTFNVPVPGPAPGQSVGAASAWVGIDGDTCGSAILQTGVDFIYENGGVSYDAWFEWYPDYAYDFSGITISPGDSITAIVEAASTTLGYAYLINNSNGQEVGVEISSPYALCEQDAEWIVEDFEENGGLVPFANFGTVTFTNAGAYANAGGGLGPNAGIIFDIQQGSVLTSVSVGGGSVTVSYV